MLQGSGAGRGVFVFDEDFSPCRLQASLVSLRFGHARGKTTFSCFLALSRRFATRSTAQMRTSVRITSNGFQDFPQNPTLPQNKRKYQMIENAENPVIYSLRASPFSRWRFALLCRRQRLAEQSAWAFLRASFQIRFHLIINRFSAFSLSQKPLLPSTTKLFASNTISNEIFRYCTRFSPRLATLDSHIPPI